MQPCFRASNGEELMLGLMLGAEVPVWWCCCMFLLASFPGSFCPISHLSHAPAVGLPVEVGIGCRNSVAYLGANAEIISDGLTSWCVHILTYIYIYDILVFIICQVTVGRLSWDLQRSMQGNTRVWIVIWWCLLALLFIYEAACNAWACHRPSPQDHEDRQQAESWQNLRKRSYIQNIEHHCFLLSYQAQVQPFGVRHLRQPGWWEGTPFCYVPHIVFTSPKRWADIPNSKCFLMMMYIHIISSYYIILYLTYLEKYRRERKTCCC